MHALMPPGRYYELKLIVVVWLMFCSGADKIYRTCRQTLKKLARVAPFLFPRRKQLSEREAIAQLPRPLRRQARELGLRAAMEGLTCNEDVIRQFGPAPLIQVSQPPSPRLAAVATACRRRHDLPPSPRPAAVATAGDLPPRRRHGLPPPDRADG